MKAARLNEHGHSLQLPCYQLTLVAGDAGLREPGNRRIGNANWIAHLVGDEAESRSEHDRHARFALSKTIPDRLRRRPNLTLPPSPVPLPRLSRHKSMPARVADKKLARVPAIMARNPSRARSCLRSGASAPIPPI